MLLFGHKAKEVKRMIKKFLNSKWWYLTAAIASLATVGYAVYMAKMYHVIMVWLFMASIFMTVYEFWKFAVKCRES